MRQMISKYAPVVYSVLASLVFLDSLRYKFTNARETQEIFGRLDAWAADLGAGGLFAQTGLFGQYVIGSAELVASSCLILGLLLRRPRVQTLGALIAVAVMTGAVSFHLFTPLGIDPNNDGGGLFAMAVIVWASSLLMLAFRHKMLIAMVKELIGIISKRETSGISSGG